MDDRVYLDHAATTPLDPRVRHAMAPFLDAVFGNPSSLHEAGRKAHEAVEAGRAEVAALIGARPSEIVFTGQRHRGRQPGDPGRRRRPGTGRRT